MLQETMVDQFQQKLQGSLFVTIYRWGMWATCNQQCTSAVTDCSNSLNLREDDQTGSVRYQLYAQQEQHKKPSTSSTVAFSSMQDITG